MLILFIGILCLVGGFYMGRLTAPAPENGSGLCLTSGQAPEETAETERLRQEQRAFSMIMGYSADMAYGLDKSRTVAFEGE